MENLELELVRTHINVPTPQGVGTFGELHIKDAKYDGKPTFFTCEDEVRDQINDISRVKVKGKTAIPLGVYEVVVTPSPKFKRFLPLLLDVPNFEGIRIHTGGNPKHSSGCILVGNATKRAFNMPIHLLEGGKAEKALMARLGEVQGEDFKSFYKQIWITIVQSADAEEGSSK